MSRPYKSFAVAIPYSRHEIGGGQRNYRADTVRRCALLDQRVKHALADLWCTGITEDELTQGQRVLIPGCRNARAVAIETMMGVREKRAYGIYPGGFCTGYGEMRCKPMNDIWNSIPPFDRVQQLCSAYRKHQWVPTIMEGSRNTIIRAYLYRAVIRSGPIEAQQQTFNEHCIILKNSFMHL